MFLKGVKEHKLIDHAYQVLLDAVWIESIQERDDVCPIRAFIFGGRVNE